MTRKTPRSPTLASVLVVAVAVAVGCDATPLETDRSQAAEVEARSAGASVETADVVGQGPDGPVVAEEGATLRRTPNGISAQFSMPTPEPGTYTYPSGPPGGAWTDEQGPPEAFTLWAFTFNDPEACAVPNECTPADLGDPAGGGAFFVAGHVFGGPHLTLSGRVSTNTEPFPTGTPGAHLENVEGAQVLLAVAPHGALDPELLPEQIQTPTQPGPDIWWLAVFD